MGCSLSCVSSSPRSTFNTTRVVHLNGFIEEFDYPVSAGEVTGKPTRHFLCTRAQLIVSAAGAFKPLHSSTQLQRGQVYFLLPYSTIQGDVSPVDLASVARKLTRVAESGRSQAKSSFSAGSSPGWSSPAGSPNRFSCYPQEITKAAAPPETLQRSPKKGRSWKPILDTIREKSFNRRSESDVQESTQ